MGTALAVRLRFTSLVVLVLIGTWLGHAIEYGIVAGWRGLDLGLSGPLHSYMVPAAAGLALAAFLLARRVVAATWLMGRQYDALRRRLGAGVRRDGSPLRPTDGRDPAQHAHGLAVLAVVGAAQICLYLIQENVEAIAAGAPVPGLGAVTGAHWTAPLVHLAVASVLTLAWFLCHIRLRARERALAVATAFIHMILDRLRSDPPAPPLPLSASPSMWLPPARAPRAPPFAIAS